METRTLPAELASLAEIRRFVKEAAGRAGIDDSRTYQLQLAVDEIATNVIQYGYKDAGDGAVISIGSEVNGQTLVITLRDQSPPFDPRAMQIPQAQDLVRPLEERKIGGLGIFLAIHGVDRFEYRHEDGANLNIFEVRSGHA
jgi:anti-sigma regulatory factor (Ser/Thr protein kinase)